MMKKEINSSMKKAFYGLDWTICFLWAIGVVVVGYGWFPYFPVNLVALMVLFRIVCSFALYKGEKKAWASGLVALALMALKWLMDADVHMWILTSKAYAMMGMETDKPREEVFPWVLKVWLGLFPVVAYAVNAMRKGGMVDNLTWKEALGLLLWTDRRAKTYCALLLVALFALYFGLALYDRACALACVVAPMVSLYLLQRLRSVAMGKLWVVVIAMVPFFLSQFDAGLERVAMLALSLCAMAYACGGLLRSVKDLPFYVVVVGYLGVLLPCMAIGSNPYCCLDVARVYRQRLDAYPGILVVKDPETGKVGLRDRYGMLVKPEFDSFAFHTANNRLGVLEMRRNGYYTLYDLRSEKRWVADHIDHSLQDRICKVVEGHANVYDYESSERMEIRVTELASNKLDTCTGQVSSNKLNTCTGLVSNNQLDACTKQESNKLVACVKARKMETVYYDCDPVPFIPTDSIARTAGEVVRDTVVTPNEFTLHSISYAQVVTVGKGRTYLVQVLLARKQKPTQQEAVNLVQNVVGLLRK